jgi:multidrug efflux pump subunit AcrA (membrane-fusion protein)
MTAVFELDDAAIPLGAVVELQLVQKIKSSGFWIPLSALTESDRGLWGVYVINDDSLVERHLVEVVHTESDRAFVRGTLSPNDRVIRTGVQRIVPGQRVELAQN